MLIAKYVNRDKNRKIFINIKPLFEIFNEFENRQRNTYNENICMSKCYQKYCYLKVRELSPPSKYEVTIVSI